MKNFIGIDLGTTNSSISSFDGDKVKIWKSPEQNDITPSVIFMNIMDKELMIMNLLTPKILQNFLSVLWVQVQK